MGTENELKEKFIQTYLVWVNLTNYYAREKAWEDYVRARDLYLGFKPRYFFE
jgi:hypothetical protein